MQGVNVAKIPPIIESKNIDQLLFFDSFSGVEMVLFGVNFSFEAIGVTEISEVESISLRLISEDFTADVSTFAIVSTLLIGKLKTKFLLSLMQASLQA